MRPEKVAAREKIALARRDKERTAGKDGMLDFWPAPVIEDDLVEDPALDGWEELDGWVETDMQTMTSQFAKNAAKMVDDIITANADGDDAYLASGGTSELTVGFGGSPISPSSLLSGATATNFTATGTEALTVESIRRTVEMLKKMPSFR